MKLNDIKDAIFAKLKTAYPSGYGLYGEESQQGFIRPAFFVQLIPTSISTVNWAHKEKMIMVDIHYFSELKTKRDMWDMADALEDLLGRYLDVSDRSLFIDEIEPDIEDNVLHFKFTLNFIDTLEVDDIEMMGELLVEEEL